MTNHMHVSGNNKKATILIAAAILFILAYMMQDADAGLFFHPPGFGTRRQHTFGSLLFPPFSKHRHVNTDNNNNSRGHRDEQFHRRQNIASQKVTQQHPINALMSQGHQKLFPEVDMIQRFAEVQRDHEAHMKQLFSNMQFLTKNDDSFNIDAILKQMDANYGRNIIDEPVKSNLQQTVSHNKMKNDENKNCDAVNINKKVMAAAELKKPELKRQNAIPPSRGNSAPSAYKVTYHVFGEVGGVDTTLNVTQHSSIAKSADMVQVPIESKQQHQQKNDDEELLIVDHDNEDHLSDDQIDKMLNSTTDDNEDVSQHRAPVTSPNKTYNQSNIISIDQEINNNNPKKIPLSYTFQFISQSEDLESNLQKWDKEVEKFIHGYTSNSKAIQDNNKPTLTLNFTRNVEVLMNRPTTNDNTPQPAQNTQRGYVPRYNGLFRRNRVIQHPKPVRKPASPQFYSTRPFFPLRRNFVF